MKNRRGKKSLLRKGVCQEQFLQIAMQAAKMHLLQTRSSRAELQQRHREMLASMAQAEREAYLAQMAAELLSLAQHLFCVRFSQYLGYIMFRLSKAFLHTFKAFVRVFFAVTSGG